MFEFGKKILSDTVALLSGQTAIRADIASVQTDTTGIIADTIKIDEQTTLGLLGTSNSLAYRVHEIEKHLHGYEKWLGLAGTPSGETHRADRITLKPEPFQIDAGNDAFSAWYQILGSSDTPIHANYAKYDLHEIQVVNHERNSTTHVLQIVTGESSGIAAKLAAEDFTEKVFITPAAPAGEMGTVFIQDVRADATEKAWARLWVKGADTGTMDFYIGLHEYPG